MGDAHRCSGPPVSEMTYTVSSGTLNPSIPYLCAGDEVERVEFYFVASVYRSLCIDFVAGCKLPVASKTDYYCVSCCCLRYYVSSSQCCT